MTKGRAHRIAETAGGAGDGIEPRHLTRGDKWGPRETLEGCPQGELPARESPSNLRPVLRHDGLFAVDRIFFRYRSNLHTEHVWKLTSEGLVATQAIGAALETLRDVPDFTLVALTHKLEPVSAEDEPPLIESAAAVASQIEGNVAARVLRVLYRIANDPPYYRQPLIEVEMNELLDDLGYERAKDGYHDPNNRARVRDVLLALARVELRGQIYDPATQIRDLYVAPLIALRGGRYRHEETRDISVADLMEKGLPLSLRIELGWYAGVRLPDGQPGKNFALLPRDLAFYQGLPSADQLSTADRLIEFLWLRYSRQRGASRDIVATLAEALAKSGIHNKNTTRARDSLTQALRHLIERGLVERHTELPRARSGSFVATLRLPPAYGRTDADLSLGEDATGNPGMLVQKGMRTDAGQGDRDEVSGVQGDKEPDRAHASIVYQRVVVFQGTLRSAEHVWRLIYDRAQQQLSPAIKSHLSSVYPEWRVERLSGGAEGLYTLCLGITPALFHRLHGELPALQAFADAMWPGVIALEFTPRRPLP